MSDTLYLCLDLQPRAGVIVTALDVDMPLPALLTNRTANSARFERNWQCFTDVDAAKAYTEANPTVVLIPLAADVVPLEAVH